MVTTPVTRRRPQPGRYSRGEPTLLVPIKMTPDLRQRFRVAAATDDLTYAKLIESLLDERDKRRERAQRPPTHPPRPVSVYPGGGV